MNFLLRFSFCVSLFCLASILLSMVTFAQTGACELLSESLIEKQMSGAKTDCYQVSLPKDSFLQIRAEQKGIDIKLKMFDEKGRLLAEIDGLNGTQGFEILSFIAPEPGIYKLEITGSDATAKGVYVIFREALRIADEKDRRQIDAQAAFAQAKKSALPEEALKEYQKAAELFRQNADKNGEAKALFEAGLISRDSGEKNAALTFFDKALTLYKAIPNQLEVAKTLTTVGTVYATSGDYKEAAKQYQQALPLFKDSDKLEKADALKGIGDSYLRLSDYPKALESYDQALVLFRAAFYLQGEADTLSNSGLIYLELGQKQKALDNFKKALEIVRKINYQEGEVALFNNIGRAYDDLGDKQEALKNFNLALSKTSETKMSDREARASILLSLGKINVETGNNRKALENYQESLQLFRAINNKFGEITAINSLGNIYSRMGEKPKALEYYHLALQLFRSFGSKRSEGSLLNNLMVVSALSGNLRMAIFYGKQSVNVIQEIRASIQKLDEKSQRSFIKIFENTYRELAAFLIEEKRFPEAQQVLVLLKEEELYQYTRGNVGLPAKSLGKLELNNDETEAAQKYRELTDKSIKIKQRIAEIELEKRGAPLSAEKEAEFQKLRTDLTSLDSEFLQKLAMNFSRSKPIESVASATVLTQTQQKKLAQFGKDTVLLTTLMTGIRYYVIITTGDTQTAKRFDFSREELNKKIVNLREVLEDSRTDVLPATQELYRILVKPLEADLQQLNAKTLLWSLDGALRYVPFAALHDGQSFMVEKYTNVVVTLAQTSAETENSLPNRPALGAGVSVGFENFPPLPQVPDELNAIVGDKNAKNPKRIKGLFTGKQLLNQAFTRQNFAAALKEKYGIVHLATHFKFSPGKDTDSFLLLGDGDKLNLAELRTSEMFDFTGVELLTLSACETALGTADANGAEIESFGVIAQRRGAKTVLATLWSIADEKTPLLMTEFYKRYKAGNGKISKAEALRQAQLTLLKKSKNTANFSHPAYWSAFIIFGNGNNF